MEEEEDSEYRVDLLMQQNEDVYLLRTLKRREPSINTLSVPRKPISHVSILFGLFALSMILVAAVNYSGSRKNESFLSNYLDLVEIPLLVCKKLLFSSTFSSVNVGTTPGCVDLFLNQNDESNEADDKNYATVLTICGCEKTVGDGVFTISDFESLGLPSSGGVPSLSYISTGPKTAVTLTSSNGRTVIIPESSRNDLSQLMIGTSGRMWADNVAQFAVGAWSRCRNLPSSCDLLYTVAPTAEPTKRPTKSPSIEPSQKPTLSPTYEPTMTPSFEPTLIPSQASIYPVFSPFTLIDSFT